MNFRHLHSFHLAAKEGSLAKAEKLHSVSASIMSEQIKVLEARFDKKLFHRTSKGMSLTIFGQCIYDYTRIIFDDVGKTLEELIVVPQDDERYVRSKRQRNKKPWL